MYPLDQFDNRPVEAYGRMFGADLSLICPTWNGLNAAAIKGSPSYLYRFDYNDFVMGKYLGAAHSMEIPFVFNTLDRPPADLIYTRRNMAPAKQLEQVMQGYWTNFARTGDPNGPGLPTWPKYDPTAADAGMIFDTNVRAATIWMKEKCAFWETYSTEHHSSTEILMRNRGKHK